MVSFIVGVVGTTGFEKSGTTVDTDAERAEGSILISFAGLSLAGGLSDQLLLTSMSTQTLRESCQNFQQPLQSRYGRVWKRKSHGTWCEAQGSKPGSSVFEGEQRVEDLR